MFLSCINMKTESILLLLSSFFPTRYSNGFHAKIAILYPLCQPTAVHSWCLGEGGGLKNKGDCRGELELGHQCNSGGRGVDERVSFENGLNRFENGLQHGGAQEVAWWHKRQLRRHRCLHQTGAQGGRGDAGDDDVGDDIYIMMSVCLSEKSSLLGFSWFLVGFHGF